MIEALADKKVGELTEEQLREALRTKRAESRPVDPELIERRKAAREEKKAQRIIDAERQSVTMKADLMDGDLIAVKEGRDGEYEAKVVRLSDKSVIAVDTSSGKQKYLKYSQILRIKMRDYAFFEKKK
jgi:predicted  nucleic acid-binding Zn-ribbon protein